jgi:acetyl-CoA carboxylase biotin carboxyl carrier protein
VADEVPNNNPRPFNVKTVKYLITLMSQNDLSEIDLREGELRIRLLRGPRGGVTVSTHPPLTPAMAAPAPTIVAAPAAPAAVAPAKADKKLVEIKSPTPGTFYASPNPDAAPFVRAGSRVTSTTVVCLIEAMKIFNEITADCTGVVTEVLVENQQPVEYGQVLFRVDPTG